MKMVEDVFYTNVKKESCARVSDSLRRYIFSCCGPIIVSSQRKSHTNKNGIWFECLHDDFFRTKVLPDIFAPTLVKFL